MLTEAERSKLLYLIDALQVSPHLSQQLIRIVEKSDSSEAYFSIIKSLKESSNIVLDTTKLRKDLL
jgi:hypothetical protein